VFNSRNSAFGTRTNRQEHLLLVSALCVLVACGGCGKEPRSAATADLAEKTAHTLITVQELMQNPNIIHEKLRATNPTYQGNAVVVDDPQNGLVGQINSSTVKDLSGLRGIPFAALDLRGTLVSDIAPLQGMPLTLLGLEKTGVTDITPLQGCKLQKLYLNDTAVADLSPLRGMPIEELMLVNTRVSDLSPLKGMPLKMLWLNGAPVSDIGSISACPLISLTLEGTEIADLSPLAAHPTLQRLHIGNTKVTDLSPLKGLKLTRLIFDPTRITRGLEIARGMTLLKEIGTTLERRMRPEQFWAMYDRRTK